MSVTVGDSIRQRDVPVLPNNLTTQKWRNAIEAAYGGQDNRWRDRWSIRWP